MWLILATQKDIMSRKCHVPHKAACNGHASSSLQEPMAAVAQGRKRGSDQRAWAAWQSAGDPVQEIPPCREQLLPLCFKLLHPFFSTLPLLRFLVLVAILTSGSLMCPQLGSNKVTLPGIWRNGTIGVTLRKETASMCFRE